MSDMTPLRNNAIVRNASVGVSPPHGPVKTGELSLVQVKAAPGGPRINEGQQKPVQIMAPNSRGAVATGALPMIQVKMTSQGPQLDDGRGNNQSVIIRDMKPRTSANALPMVQVNMTTNGPQPVQTLPTTQSAPPQIRATAPALSAPRVATAPIPAPLPELTEEQLMLCRHTVDKFLTEARDLEGHEEYIALGETTIAALDQVMAAKIVRDAAPIATMGAPTLAATASTSISPAPSIATPAATIAATPSVSYVAGRVGGGVRMQPVTGQVRTGYTMGGSRGQRNAGLAPRRTTARRPGDSPLPMVQVKMDGQRAQVQNQAEYAAARQAALAPQEAPAPAVAEVVTSNDITIVVDPALFAVETASTETILEPSQG